MAFAVNAPEVATPLALVFAVCPPPANVPLALVWGGAVNVTVTPASGFPLPSRTIAVNGDPNTALTVALCGVPPVAAIDGDPAEVTVRLNDLVAACDLASVTRAVKLLVPLPVGVPERTPVFAASVKPAGRDPDATDQL